MKVDDNFYRGGFPTVQDVQYLKDNFNINKIVSLDQESGAKINRICKLSNIKHIMLPLPVNLKTAPLIKLFSNNLKELLTKEGPVFLHCHAGKDRTGMVSAIYRCKYQNWSCQDALKEAYSLGFGIDLNPQLVNLYKKLIVTSCKKKHDHLEDQNNADIVNNSRFDIIDSPLGTKEQKTFAPKDTTKVFPNDNLYNPSYEQYPTRQNLDMKINLEVGVENAIPGVGLYDSNSGIKGFGPVDNGGGFTAT
jgi:hypothetical protein